MVRSKQHVSRSSELRGAGAVLALPLLASMLPEQTPLVMTAANPKTRFTGIFIPHGAAPGWGVPEAGGPGETTSGPRRKNLTNPLILDPLRPSPARTAILTGLWTKAAAPPHRQDAAAHCANHRSH